MAYIPVPNTAQLELVYNWQGEFCQNVLHYTKASPWTIDLLTDLCAEAVNVWDSVMPNLISNTMSLINVRATDLASQTGPVVNYSTGLPIEGNGVSPSLPNNCALVITKRTALRGRSYRGRIYQCGLTEGAVTGNAVASGTITASIVAWEAFLALPITGDEALMSVVSRYNEGQPRTTGVASLVTALTTDGIIDSQRRRLPGRGS